jgi:uncharacterized FlgJ-related protein
MLRVTGRITLIYSHEVVLEVTTINLRCLILVIKKQMNKKMRSIQFEVMGKLINELRKYRKGDKIAVWFYIDAKSNNKKWYNALRAVEIEKPNVIQKNTNKNQLNFIQYDDK